MPKKILSQLSFAQTDKKCIKLSMGFAKQIQRNHWNEASDKRSRPGPWRIPATIEQKLSSISTISAASFAISEPIARTFLDDP